MDYGQPPQLIVFFSATRPGHVLHWLEYLLHLLQKRFVNVCSTLLHLNGCFHVLSHLGIKGQASVPF